MNHAIPRHFPEYLIEASLLACFMVSACVTVAAVQHPASWVARGVRSGIARRALIGLAMGLTAFLLITSPLGKRSGAHMNPATTLAFFALGKIQPLDALMYVASQFAGAIAGVAAARVVLNRAVSHGSIRCVMTSPPDHSRRALRVAWLAEFVITFGLFLTVLVLSNRADTAAYTPLVVGGLVALFITFEAPLSGMSMNPARTLGSAVHARDFRSLWVYFTAPPLAMLAAAFIYTGAPGAHQAYCAKLDHRGDQPCPFNCRINEMRVAPHEPGP